VNQAVASDEAEIARLLYRYARAVDSKDWELYRSVFTDDAHIDYSSAGAIVGSRDEVVDWFAANFGVIPWSMHYITNIESEITGDNATVRAMFYNPMQLPGMAEMSFLRRVLPPRAGAYRRRVAQPCTPRGECVVRQSTRFLKPGRISLRRPIDRRRRRFHGRECHARCMTLPAHARA
jgi:hypothetical protein